MPVRNAIHPTAAAGFSSAATAYARGRPPYPRAIVEWLRGRLGAGPSSVIAELGAGTGKFTPCLLETEAKVIAIEPLVPMLETLATNLSDVVALAGSAQAVPLPDRSVDAVVYAQAFHWFAVPAALAEIQRVLRPGGRLGLVWNVKDDRVDWVAKFDRILERRQGDAPRFRSGEWRKLFPAPGFGPLIEDRFPHAHHGPPEIVLLERARSISFIATLPPHERTIVENEVRALITSEPALAGRDQVTVPYETFAYHAVKSD